MGSVSMEKDVRLGPKRVLITGATGLVGRRLIQAIEQDWPNTRIHALSRSVRENPPGGPHHFVWNVDRGDIDPKAMEGVDVVFHLAGETVAQRWTPEVRKRIRSSRIDALNLLSRECTRLDEAPRLVSASAIGWYPSAPHEQQEGEKAGQGFISQVVVDWEAAAAAFGQLGGGAVSLRIGLVVAPEGGVLRRLHPLYRAGLGSPLSPGSQWQSWIHADDLVRMFMHAATHEAWSGAFNAVSPEPVTQATFSRQLAEALHRPHFLPKVPRFALKAVFGEASHALLASHRIRPQRALSEGFHFQHNTLKSALSACYP